MVEKSRLVDGIRVSRIDVNNPQTREYYQHRLLDRFQGDRYKAIVTLDEQYGAVKLAMVHVIDLHNPYYLMSDESGGTRFWLEPVHRALLSSRTSDGSPYVSEAWEAARKFLNKYDQTWRTKQGNYGYLCIDLAMRPASEMDDFLYGIIM